MFRKSLRLLSLAATVATAAAYVQKFVNTQRLQRWQQDTLDRARWESEGGATSPDAAVDQRSCADERSSRLEPYMRSSASWSKVSKLVPSPGQVAVPILTETRTHRSTS